MGRYPYTSVVEHPRYPGRKHYFEFVFKLVKVDGYWELGIVHLPDYGLRYKSNHIIHTLPSGRCGEKICVSAGKEPRTLEAAKTIARNWADLQAVYILTGITPNKQLAENQRKKERKKIKKKIKEVVKKCSSMVGFIGLIIAGIIFYVAVAQGHGYLSAIFSAFCVWSFVACIYKICTE